MNNLFLNSKTPKEINLIIASQIKEIRKRRKLSQLKLSDKSGVSLGSIKRFETSGDISLLSLTKIAIALDISDSLESLFTDIPFQSIEEVIHGQTS